MSWAAIAATVVGAGLSAGVAYASQPELVNPASSSRKTSRAALKALPVQRQVESLARLGKSGTYHADNWLTPKQALKQGFIDQEAYQKIVNELIATGRMTGQATGPATGYLEKTPVRKIGRELKINVGKRTADFEGYGDADVQGKLAGDLARTGLDLQKKYGTQFAAEAANQAALADPEGTKARQLLASEINRMEDERQTRQHPVSDALDAQILDELKRGRNTSPDMEAITARLRDRRGDVGADVDLADNLTRGSAGERRLTSLLQKGTSYLGSGATPEDTAFREKQQSLANMSSFLAGRTPQSQFASLSGGQQGATPGFNPPSLPGVDPNLMSNAQQAGVQSYTAGVRNAATQVSPWFVGLSALTKGAAAAGTAR